MIHDDILLRVGDYYTGKLRAHGATPRGVDWSSAESQELRFAELARLWGLETSFSLTDYGCGYAALAGYLRRQGARVGYVGFDVSAEMLARAAELWGGPPGIELLGDASRLHPTDYAVASGVFNVKLDTDDARWLEYVLAEIEVLDRLGRKGFAFNALSLYSEPERRRPDLYYADPLALFDHCKRRFSPRVALLHDYPLYEFTVLVRRKEDP